MLVLEVEGGERGKLGARDERQRQEGECGGEVEAAVEEEVEAADVHQVARLVRVGRQVGLKQISNCNQQVGCSRQSTDRTNFILDVLLLILF